MVGTQPDFQAVFGTRCAGHVRATARTQPDFQAFLGSFLGTMSKSCPGRVLTAARILPDFQAFLSNFWDTVCRPCPGPIGTQPNFQAFLGNFWDTVRRPHLRRVLVMAAPYPGSGRDAGTFSSILRHFKAHDVQAMLGMQARFQAFLYSFWDKCAGHVRDAPTRGKDAG
ncbi:Hypothetical predicted protein [Olea europaea subsp. europaea]|uniref:Uncharacterized protein n=1 Tax=Olea europaea subsp. europaea TaxID=158383 RepID=A0A8S0S944_OLEEU|nr:Hypothetical predicted protein [Olea europaea subsp. europaea]